MKKNKKYRIILTPGEPAGIGPDVTISIAQKQWPVELVVCADPNLLLNRAKKINLPLKLNTYNIKNKIIPCTPGELSILEIPLTTNTIPGKLNPKNNSYIINCLEQAIQKCMNNEFSALITGPVHKAILSSKKTIFHGHTEFLAKNLNCKQPIMMLSNKKLRVALMTTHIPISSVPQNITKKSLLNTILNLAAGLKKYFNIPYPKIYVCGLNPHAGESGYIGREEVEIIIPTINLLKKNKNLHIKGPYPADTIFQPKYLRHADVILAMYHDQGLPVLKYSGFGNSVNITLGLPFIRTSVDHGSALELAGTQKVNPNSMKMAILTAINMISNAYEKKIL